MIDKWFVIVNPTAGNGASKKKWPFIFDELLKQNLEFEFEFTAYKKHAVELVQKAIEKGFINFISVGGDGTLHHIVNGILSLNPSNILEIKIGVIPIGTGNDWVKTYAISKNYKKAIEIIKQKNTVLQDIGRIEIIKNNTFFYFNNLAGIGLDGYVVYKVNNFKNLGFLAYLVGALVSLSRYKKSVLEISFNTTVIKEKTLMLLIGICKYSGGGMQLTKESNPADGLFDISIIHKINFFDILFNIPGLFNGKITNHKLVNTFKTTELNIKVLDEHKTYIQADGELIGSGYFSVSMIPKALQFIVPL